MDLGLKGKVAVVTGGTRRHRQGDRAAARRRKARTSRSARARQEAARRDRGEIQKFGVQALGGRGRHEQGRRHRALHESGRRQVRAHRHPREQRRHVEARRFPRADRRRMERGHRAEGLRRDPLHASRRAAHEEERRRAHRQHHDLERETARRAVLPDERVARGGSCDHQGAVEGIRGRQHPREHGVHRQDQVGPARAALHEGRPRAPSTTTRNPRKTSR